MITLLYMGLFRIDTSKHGSRGIKMILYKLTSSEDEQSPRKEILNSLYSLCQSTNLIELFYPTFGTRVNTNMNIV